MKKFFSILVVSLMVFVVGCNDKYDDSRIREDINEIDSTLTALEAKVKSMNDQIVAISAMVKSNFISFISTDKDGNHVITYKNGDLTQTITLATQADMVSVPILGVAKFTDDKYYWRSTTDGGATYQWLNDTDSKMIPLGGTAPVVGIDKDGFWTINGQKTLDRQGQPVLANDVSNTLFRSVEVDEKSGVALFTLADGTVLSIQIFEALGIRFDVPIITPIADRNQAVIVNYTLYGTHTDGAIVDCFTTYNVSATVDSDQGKITVKLDPTAESGNIIVMAHANGNTVLKPLFFSYGTAEIDIENPTAGNVITLEGEMSSFDIKVSANITYDVAIEKSAQSWLLVKAPTKAPKVTTTHSFTADYYENAAGVARNGTITFSNALYNVSTQVVVKQKPTEPQSKGGISTAADLEAFSTAVNAGGSTARWQDETGAVILLNDIDMASVTTWIPIGKTEGEFNALTAFSGVFDGKGFSIKNLRFTFDVSSSSSAFGLFGALKDATVKNLKLGSDDTDNNFIFTGLTPAKTAIAALAGYMENSTVQSCTNYVNVSFTGQNSSGTMLAIGGFAGAIKGGIIGGDAKSLGCTNFANITCGKVANEANGATGVNIGGFCGIMQKASPAALNYCVNYGDVSAPAGRGGGLVGTIELGRVSNSDNRGTVQDDIVGQFEGRPLELTYNVKRMGGLVGGTAVADVVVEYCTNYGNVFSHVGCRTGGFVGHNAGQIVGCVNKGAILADLFVEGNGTNRHGPGWACGYSAASSATYTNISGSAKGGYVGSYTTFKDNPKGAPEASNDNALCHAPQNYKPELNN